MALLDALADAIDKLPFKYLVSGRNEWNSREKRRKRKGEL